MPAADPPLAPGIRTRSIAANGLVFETLVAGEGNRLVLFLHGFPSHAICWRDQLSRVAGLGFRAWAPNQRGYGGSSRPRAVSDYTIDRLLEDIGAVIDAAGARSIVLVAHDWGGLLAWFFAARRIRTLDGLVIINAPHPACAAVAFRRWAQMRRGWYIAAFQIPWLPDWILRFNHAWMIGKLMVAVAASKAVFDAASLTFYRDAAARPGAVTAMLNWYRGLLRGGVPPEMKGRFPVIETPTLVIWGDGDVVLDPSCIEGVEAYVPNVDVRRLPGVSHWVQEEAPDTVNALLAEFLGKLG
jgi:pimeloyl-ACP methyl ester carboxylesterase